MGADHWIFASLCPIGSTTCTSLGAPGTVEEMEQSLEFMQKSLYVKFEHAPNTVYRRQLNHSQRSYVVGLVKYPFWIIQLVLTWCYNLNLDFVTKGAFPNVIDCCNTSRVECSRTDRNIQSSATVSTRHGDTYFRECVEISVAGSVDSDGSIAMNTLDRAPSDSDFQWSNF